MTEPNETDPTHASKPADSISAAKSAEKAGDSFPPPSSTQAPTTVHELPLDASPQRVATIPPTKAASDRPAASSTPPAAGSASADEAAIPAATSETGATDAAPVASESGDQLEEVADDEAPVDAPLAASAPPSASDEADRAPLLPTGNPLRWARGGGTALVGIFGMLMLCAYDGQLSFGVPLGVLLSLIGAWGICDLLGTFDDGLAYRKDDVDADNQPIFAAERLAASMPLDRIARPVALCVVAFLAFAGSLAGGQWGAGPQALWGFLVTATFLGFIATLFRVGVVLGPWAVDETGAARPLLKREGFWVVGLGGLLYLPFMGIYSLWDPWETHYGEVAREILNRDDWISIWWANEGYFYSKPILNFWLQALSMATLHTHYHADQMLIGAEVGGAHPEWAVRTPIVLMTILAMYFLYKGVAKVFGRRAGLLGSIALATMPDWYFLAHQTMTDMPCIAAMSAAMGLFLLGLYTGEDERARVYEIKVGRTNWRLSVWHLVFGSILLCAIPQIMYLLSRNVELVTHGPGAKGFRFHFDEFHAGSPGNCGLPSQEACMTQEPVSIPKGFAHPDSVGGNLWRFFGGFEPSLQALIWSVILGVLLYMNWGERRMRRLLYLAAWFFVAVSFMGKGPLGGIPVICALAFIATKKRWIELTKVEIVGGLLIIFAVGLPWWVAMYVRHGSVFTDRLIFHDMFARAFNHVHDTNEGDDTSIRFYIWQLGYALFPWTALAPLGLVYWARRTDSADQGRGDGSIFLLMWFLFAFALFSFMGTKFHHYIFPAVPPIAMLIGVVLDDILGQRELVRPGTLAAYIVGLLASALLMVAGVARCLPGDLLGVKPNGGLADGNKPVGFVLAAVGIAILIATVRRYRSRREVVIAIAQEDEATGNVAVAVKTVKPGEPIIEDRRDVHERLMIGAAAAAGALALVLVGRDLSIQPQGADQPGAIRLLQLFTYNYRRAWPDSLDFSAVLTGFTVVAILVAFSFAIAPIRRHAVTFFCALGVVWALWGLDVYMVKTAPHWGQHETIEAYYRDRASADEPLVAYQMNWKGENFYTSGHTPIFISSGATFTAWIKAEREKGIHTAYFITEHSRVGGLKSEVGGKSYKELTTKELDNKFVVIKAEL